MLSAGLVAGALAVPGIAAAAVVRSGRPVLTHGLQSGDVTATSGTVWARADRPARLLVEYGSDPEFRRARRILGPVVTPRTDLTGKTILPALPPARDVHYRITPIDLHDSTLTGQSQTGHFRTAPIARGDVSFLWAGDLAGQGWGIDTARGGFRIFSAMRKLNPDFYICNGDNIYADNPIKETVPLPDGSTWRNLVTVEKSKVAETLTEYRGNYKYNLMDQNLREFYSQVAQIQQWDDHETHNNWYPGQILDDPQYTEKRMDVLASRARRAFHEFTPINPVYDPQGRVYRVLHHGPLLDVFVLDMRTFRDANSTDALPYDNGGILGRYQAEWLKRELAASTATWKVISNDMPLGMVVPDGTDHFEAVSQGDPGHPLGREIQIADILSFLKRQDIRNVVWLTTDVHYTAAQYFDPEKAAFPDFHPFWQFVAGPLNAGAFPPDKLDGTFGVQQVFVKAPTVANTSPASEFQFFGQVSINGASKDLTVRLRDNSGAAVWSTTLHARHR
ncbi:alkaline phosphatase D family protein [Fodinicola feengrottensis]|uniref:Alkaline phosphatase D family protein n=1 Tax=Fodinicola feengrottensis TaxID=435914 RepID=A0ABN2HZS6_9ACTN